MHSLQPLVMKSVRNLTVVVGGPIMMSWCRRYVFAQRLPRAPYTRGSNPRSSRNPFKTLIVVTWEYRYYDLDSPHSSFSSSFGGPSEVALSAAVSHFRRRGTKFVKA
jgi:hypothetical protein